MPRVPMWRRYLRLRGPDVRGDVDDELRFHLEMAERDLIAGGLSPEDARAKARERFGDLGRVTQTLEHIGERRERVERRRERLGSLVQDVRYALRALARGPTFALSALLMLALGIGANSTLFSLIDSVVLRPLPGIRDPDAIFELGSRRISYPSYRDLHGEGSAAVTGLAVFSQRTVAFGNGAWTVPGAATVVSGNFFGVLGARAELGRLLEPADDQPTAASAAVISDGFWRGQLGADPGILGRELQVNGRTVTVVGVAAPEFRGTRIGAPDAWLPIQVWPRVAPPAFGNVHLDARGWSWLTLVGRRAPGVTLGQAEAALRLVAATQAVAHPSEERLGQDLRLVPASVRATGIGDRDGLLRFIGLLAAVVALVLLITCANVANLLLARAARRRREIAVRLALGASRGRLIRQLLTESLVLALAASALGLGLTLLACAALDGATVPGLALTRLTLHPDWHVLGFTIALSMATGVLFGLAPALHATRVDLVPGLGAAPPGSGRAPSRLRAALVAGQVALTLVLLVGAGLFARSLGRALSIDPGFRAEGVAMVQADPGLARYDAARAAAYFAEAQRQVSALPGVTHAAWTSSVPLSEDENVELFQVEGYTPGPDEVMETELSLISGGFLDVLGVPLIAGRGVALGDVPGTEPVAVVNAALVRRYFPDGNAVGRHLQLGRHAVTIVGVTADVKVHALREEPKPYVYLALAQQLEDHPFMTAMTLLVRGPASPASLVPTLVHAVRAVAPEVPVLAGTFSEVLAELLLPQRFGVLLLGLFGALAVLLVSLGVFGVVAFGVSERVREIGIRMALGASSREVLGLVLGRNLLHVSVGIVLGLAGAAALARFIEAFLYGVRPLDAATFVVTPLILLAVATLAAYLPARAATRTNPAITLRAE